MAAPERFADTPDSFPLHRGRRPYMARLGPKPLDRYVRCRPKRTLATVLLLQLETSCQFFKRF
jgi:hypothetical protein